MYNKLTNDYEDKEPKCQTSIENNQTSSPASHQKQHARHHVSPQHHPRYEHSSPLPCSEDQHKCTKSNQVRCHQENTPPHCHATCNQRPYLTRTGNLQYSPACEPTCTSINETNNFQLQEVDEQPGNCRSMTNGIRTEFFWNGTRAQQDGAKRHYCNVCDDSR